MKRVEIPGREPLELAHLLLDVNGTLTSRGTLLEGVPERIEALKRELEVHLLSADTFGSLAAVGAVLGVGAAVVVDGAEKEAVVRRLGPERCAAVGKGANDALMLETAALGIAVIGRGSGG